MTTKLTIALSRYEELELYSTECGEFVEICHICDKSPSCYNEKCIAGKNLISEIGDIF